MRVLPSTGKERWVLALQDRYHQLCAFNLTYFNSTYTHCRHFVRLYRLVKDKCVKYVRFIDILGALNKYTIAVNVSLTIGDVW